MIITLPHSCWTKPPLPTSYTYIYISPLFTQNYPSSGLLSDIRLVKTACTDLTHVIINLDAVYLYFKDILSF